jgi:methionine synthase II (cobalamin-independent)
LPGGVTTALHVCRGNYRSRWLCEGSLEPVAERLFGELPYDAFLVEWDDVGRDGGYAPVRFVPPGRIAVMGLVSSKRPDLESEDEILRRLGEASAYLPYEQLGVSTQCGFASVIAGNEVDEDAQWRKLDLVARVADRVWPR